MEIKDVMGEEIQILLDKEKVEGRNIRDENEIEFRRTGKIRYYPTREEELLQPYRNEIYEYNFFNWVNDVIFKKST